MHLRYPYPGRHPRRYGAEGMTIDEVVANFPQLSGEDIWEALRDDAAAVDERELPCARG